MSTGILFDDMFLVKDFDPDGKKFDRVSRLFCDSESFKMELILDVNTQMLVYSLSFMMESILIFYHLFFMQIIYLLSLMYFFLCEGSSDLLKNKF